MVKRVFQALFAVGVVMAGLASTARAVDAPKWVAAMYIDAQGQVGLRWQPVPGATGYKVLRSTTKGTGYQQVANPAVPQHFDTGVTPGTTYYYTLQAVDAAGTSASSDERSVVVPKKTAKIAPPVWKQAVMDQTAGGINLEWQPIAGAAAYNIFRRESFKPAGKEDLIASVQAADAYLDKAELKKGIEYIYSLSVLDSAFTESDKSSPMSVKFVPKEEVKEVKQEDKVLESRKTEYLGEMVYVPDEGEVERGAVIPVSVAINDGEIFVMYNTKVVLVFSESDRRYKRRFTAQGEGGAFPEIVNFITMDPDGDLIVLDNVGQRVMKYSTRDGEFLGSWSVNDGVDPKEPLDEIRIVPNRIAYSPGGEIFVSDASNHVIRVFDSKGRLQRRIGHNGAKLGELALPSDLIFDKEGRLYVMEVANTRIQIFDKNEKPVVMFGEPGSRAGQFARPSGLTRDPDKKRLYVSDYVNNVIHVWTDAGKFEGVIKYKDTVKETMFSNTAQITRGDDGILYVIDYAAKSVVAFRDIE